MHVVVYECVCMRAVIVWGPPGVSAAAAPLRLVRAADQTRLIICDETGVFRRLLPPLPRSHAVPAPRQAARPNHPAPPPSKN